MSWLQLLLLAGYQDLCLSTAEDGDARKVRRQFGDHGSVAWKGWCRVYATLSTPFSLQVDANVMVVMDSFALPVEGTETRVNAQAQGYEYMTAYIESAKQVATNFKPSWPMNHALLLRLVAWRTPLVGTTPTLVMVVGSQELMSPHRCSTRTSRFGCYQHQNCFQQSS